jgi:hypothetical protein
LQTLQTILFALWFENRQGHCIFDIQEHDGIGWRVLVEADDGGFHEKPCPLGKKRKVLIKNLFLFL